MENQTPAELNQKTPILPASLTTVTPLSKYLAMGIFILLPFVGFWLGMQYTEPSANGDVEVPQRIEPRDSLSIPANSVSSSTGASTEANSALALERKDTGVQGVFEETASESGEANPPRTNVYLAYPDGLLLPDGKKVSRVLISTFDESCSVQSSQSSDKQFPASLKNAKKLWSGSCFWAGAGHDLYILEHSKDGQNILTIGGVAIGECEGQEGCDPYSQWKTLLTIDDQRKSVV